MLLSDKKYKDFELYVEVKIDSFCNGGIFLRSTESGQAYQVELALPGANADLFGERLEIGLAGKASAIAKVWRPGEWNSFRVRMTGEVPRVILWVNNVQMWDVQQPKNDFIAGATEGMIGFQSHWSAQYLPTPGGFNMPGAWRPGAAHRFRNIRMLLQSYGTIFHVEISRRSLMRSPADMPSVKIFSVEDPIAPAGAILQAALRARCKYQDCQKKIYAAPCHFSSVISSTIRKPTSQPLPGPPACVNHVAFFTSPAKDAPFSTCTCPDVGGSGSAKIFSL